MNSHIFKWASTLGVRVPNFQRAITWVKIHWIEDFFIPLTRSWNLDI
jgi:hypothetical protein